jgi:hypothetical protein
MSAAAVAASGSRARARRRFQSAWAHAAAGRRRRSGLAGLRVAQAVLGAGQGRLVLGLLDGLHHLLGLRHPVEGEVRVVGAGRVEVHLPHLEDPLDHRLADVHVLHPFDARLLNLSRDDPPFDVQALVRDRIRRGDALDQPDDDAQRDEDHEHDDHDTEFDAAADQRYQGGDPARHGAGERPLEVEAQDGPPGRMALEDHLLAVA